MNKEEKEQWLYEAYQYTSNFDFNRLDKYEEANDDICIDDLILDYTMLYEFHKEEIEKLNNIIEEYKNANEYHQNIIHELETMKQPNQLHSENVRLRNQLQQKENIIKEVREYIETLNEYGIGKNAKKELLEILDKGSDKE